jgi:hypothetical protein
MQKIFIFLLALSCSVATQAQSTGDGANGTDTTHRMGMHRGWGRHNGSDSLHRHDGGWQGMSRRDDREGGDRQDSRSFRKPGGFSRGGWGRGWAGEHIHYTPEQRRQVQTIDMDYRKKAADLFKNDNQTLGQYKAGLIALQKEKKGKLQALLTPEQKDQIAKRKQRMSENMQVMAAARMERLKIRLNLSDDQVASLRSKEQGLRSQLQSIHENDNLLPQQKMEAFKELGSKRKDIIKSVLTPDQLSKFNEMETDHRQHRPGEEGR